MAQRAFRQRQIDTINKLEEEVSLLRDSIRKIGQTAKNELSSVNQNSTFPSSLPLRASQQTVGSELLKAIRYAGQVAGVDESVSMMEDGHEACSNQNLSSSEQISDPVDNQLSPGDILIGTEGWLFTDTSSSSANNIPLQPKDLDYLTDPIRNDVPTTIPPQESRYSSSLDTGLTPYNLDPLLPSSNHLPIPKYLKPKNLPFHMLPYMDRKADTFAGHIFWKSLSLAFQYGTTSLVHPPPSPTTSPQSNQHTEDEKTTHFSNMLSHTSAIIGKEAALRRIGARLEFLKTGTLDTDSPLWDADRSIQLRVLIEEDAQRRGENMSDWLRIPDIVDYISSRCGVSSFAQLDALGTVSGDGLGSNEIGQEAGQGAGLVTRLVDDIAWNASCFGDGPRYRAREVKEVIDSWVDTLTW
ncbi:hypothetical protein DTO271G3_1675 [Paecilomyces variotii]|nr:hypothetical protein DTO271G3_1675 [Paecilomyces variotii]